MLALKEAQALAQHQGRRLCVDNEDNNTSVQELPKEDLQYTSNMPQSMV